MVVGEFTQETDLLVIGGGPGGYAAAFRASELGVPTVLVDPRETLGGICLHDGCVPSKALLHAAAIVHDADRAAEMGIAYPPPEIDTDGLRRWVEAGIERLARGLTATARKHQVEVIRGTAVFDDPKRVSIHDAEGGPPRVKFRRALIATGSAPIEHPVLPFDGRRVLRPGEAVHLPRHFESLLVVGQGYMAVELATVYAALGTEVCMVAPGGSLLPDADEDLVRPLQRRLAGSLACSAVGIDVETAEVGDDGLTVTFAGDRPPSLTRFDAAIVVLGQRPSSAALQLARAHVSTDADGRIVVDERMRTSNQRIFAVGDVTGPPFLADRALHQGRIAGEVIAGWGSEYDVRAVPMVAFTDPQIAWCGLTEHEARRGDIPHEVRKIPWASSGRAVGMGRLDGLTKIIYDPDSKLVLGVGLVGPNAAEMIAESALALEMGAELADLSGTMHPHPTMSELVSDAARAAERDQEPDEPEECGQEREA